MQDEGSMPPWRRADLKRRRELELVISALISSGSIPVSELERSYAGLLKALDKPKRHTVPARLRQIGRDRDTARVNDGSCIPLAVVGDGPESACGLLLARPVASLRQIDEERRTARVDDVGFS